MASKLIGMLWNDLKQAIHDVKCSGVAQFKQFCRKDCFIFLHIDVNNLFSVITNALLQFLLSSVAQPVTSFRGRITFFALGQVGLDSIFPLNKLNPHLKMAFCIYSGYVYIKKII